jgi:hypothetical protein
MGDLLFSQLIELFWNSALWIPVIVFIRFNFQPRLMCLKQMDFSSLIKGLFTWSN